MAIPGILAGLTPIDASTGLQKSWSHGTLLTVRVGTIRCKHSPWVGNQWSTQS